MAHQSLCDLQDYNYSKAAKAAIANTVDWGLKQLTLISHVLVAGKSKIKLPAELVSGESFLLSL